MTKVLGKSVVAPPLVGSTQTFITIGAFDTRDEAENCNKYINTKFARAMLSILKTTQHNPPATWAKVPLQDFTAASDIDWSQPLMLIDAQLYRKYGLNAEEIRFIEDHIEYHDEPFKETAKPTRKSSGVKNSAKKNHIDNVKAKKIFRLMLDLQRLAQFEVDDDFYQRNTTQMLDLKNQSDEELYRRFDFTPEMIQFTEENYHDARH